MLDNWYIKHIHGIEKILAICSDFDWHDFGEIRKLTYDRKYHEFNDDSDPISCLEIDFLLHMEDSPPYRVSMIFYCVTGCSIQFRDTQIHLYRFTIYDKKSDGYEISSRFHIGSHEQDAPIDFYCESFEVISVCRCGEFDD